MITISMQFFGGRGSSSGRGGGAGKAPAPQAAPNAAAQNTTQSTDPNAPNYVSQYSTGGKIVQSSSDQWEGTNDNGSSVRILDAGKSDTNLYRYGSRQIYEVDRYYADALTGLVPDMQKVRASSKAEAMRVAKQWLKAQKNNSSF